MIIPHSPTKMTVVFNGIQIQDIMSETAIRLLYRPKLQGGTGIQGLKGINISIQLQ